MFHCPDQLHSSPNWHRVRGSTTETPRQRRSRPTRHHVTHDGHSTRPARVRQRERKNEIAVPAHVSEPRQVGVISPLILIEPDDSPGLPALFAGRIYHH